MLLSIVIVSWNCKEELLGCVDSLIQHPYSGGQEILVIDNDSRDGTVPALCGRFPRVRVIQTGTNLGFGRAANLGLQQARGDFLLFLNPDTAVPEGALDAAVRIVERHPAVGVVGVGLRDGDGNLQPSCGQFLSLRSLLGGNLRPAHGKGPGPEADGRGVLWTVPKQTEVDWVMGAFMVGRREVVALIGGFDEDYFLYAEDMDLCYRLRRRGYPVLFCPEVTVTHLGNRSGARKWAERRESEIVRSEVLFLRKHHGHVSALGFRFLGGSFFLCKSMVAWMQSWTRGTQCLAEARRYWHMTAVCWGWG
ncbi:MAG: glycosyltransferase [Deltaproteobacteria bacterium]|nr:glycosyltransferase [Deltaproteobacteria bacterium]